MTHCPAFAGRPRFDLADIVREHRAELEANAHLTLQQRRVLRAIELCRTAELGGHVEACRSCGFERPVYNSCRNRHCPKCQWRAQEKWIRARAERLLPVGHFHIVCTLPSELRSVVKQLPRAVLNAFFAAASATLLELGESRLSARLGITMVLHTWTRDLRFHPHLHALVTAGGLALDGERWISHKKFLLPVRVVGKLLRGKMLAALRSLRAKLATLDELRDDRAFERWIGRLARSNWVVYAKRPFREHTHVLQYLGRYTHRVALSNQRFVDVDSMSVTFKTKDGATARLPPIEFLRRFLQHVLPDRFHKIRHSGLYAGVHVDRQLALARRALATTTTSSAPSPEPPPIETPSAQDIAGLPCPACRAPLERFPLARGPPEALA